MKRREEIEQLLGGYAAGTLTPSEQKLLFDAAMEDQELFNAIANEEPLKELLDDPESRGYLRAALDEPVAQTKKASSWWWPAAGMSMVAAALALVTVIGIQRTTAPKQDTNAAVTPIVVADAKKPIEVAKNEPIPRQPEVADRRQPVPEKSRVAAAGSTPSPVVAPPPPPQPAPVVAREETALASAPKPVNGRDSADLKELEKKGEASEKAKTAKEKDASPVKQDKLEVAVAAPPPQPRMSVAPLTGAAPGAIGNVQSAANSQQQQQQQTASQIYFAQFRQNQNGATELRPQFTTTPSVTVGPADEGAARARRDTSVTAARKAAAAGAGAGRAAAPEQQRTQQQQELSRNAVAQENAGIRYQILRRNSQGQFIQTRLDTRFESGDEIVISVDKNAGGIVNVVQRGPAAAAQWTPVAITAQTLFVARTAPIRLEKGVVNLNIVLTQNGLLDAAPPAPAPNQLTESSGNVVYVVVPGPSTAPVTTGIRLNVQ